MKTIEDELKKMLDEIFAEESQNPCGDIYKGLMGDSAWNPGVWYKSDPGVWNQRTSAIKWNQRIPIKWNHQSGRRKQHDSREKEIIRDAMRSIKRIKELLDSYPKHYFKKGD
jgi:hypothetical protein